MKHSPGLWIDQQEAIIVTLSGPEETIHRVLSHVEKHPARDPGAAPGRFESQLVKSSDRQQKALTGHLSAYYDEVIASLPEADALLVFGPGEAKNQLKQRLLEKKPHLLVTLETADFMTEPQTVAKVRAWSV
jgi:hypothetical protein